CAAAEFRRSVDVDVGEFLAETLLEVGRLHAGSRLHQDVGDAVLARDRVGVVERLFERGVDERRGGKRADSVRESGNSRAVVANFDTIADAADTEFLLVEIVHQHRVLLFQRLDTPIHYAPRLPHAAAGTDADDLNAFNAAVGTLPARECL